ncbi:hypothetical protein LZQ00_07560 [Sphingobacterium sp. SRCM116780]|uniref:hypothetical protein n=1 Tax=Sphingobacterium sp. SRCM116780 TaxID=2907623 RepID=UPI001F3AD6D0|nr:hypothetical protein [Sphingobacterium sp. SRCM116780]UIR57667.1 hypothetical protein LZQ00_07560 [Sphingobacterium sp. SRCM116780]
MTKIMKLGKLFGLMAIFFTVLTTFSACSKDDDPADNDFFIGNYKGSVGYRDGSTTINENSDGTVEVVKVGNSYNFIFNKSIPKLTGVKFEKKGDHVLVNADETSTNYIRIDNNSLTILYVKDNKTWTANCTR